MWVCSSALPQAPVTQQQQGPCPTPCAGAPAHNVPGARTKPGTSEPSGAPTPVAFILGRAQKSFGNGRLGVPSACAHRASLKVEQGYIFGSSTRSKLSAGTKQGALEKHRSALATWLHPRKISALHQRRAIYMLSWYCRVMLADPGHPTTPHHHQPSTLCAGCCTHCCTP